MASTKNLIVNSGESLLGEIFTGGEEGLPGDKSISHRAALFAALAEGESVINNFQVSGVTLPMLNALRDMNINWRLDGQQLSVIGEGVQSFHPPSEAIDCGNSGTTMRLLAGALSASGNDAILDGSTGLRRRPMNRIVEPLRQMGVQIEDTRSFAPLYIHNTSFPLNSINYQMPVASAQVKSCILLAGLMANGITLISEPGPSRDHTERMLRSMGVNVSSSVRGIGSEKKYETQIEKVGKRALSPLHMSLPGDFSSAAFVIVAACITPGSEIIIHDVGLNHTRTGLLDALIEMGADIRIAPSPEQGGEAIGDIMIRSSKLVGTHVSGDRVVRMIDEFPAFSIAAAAAEGETQVSDAMELRFKESDRISNLCEELSKIGVVVRENRDGFTILGGQPFLGGVVQHHGDHRLAMSLSIAGLLSKTPVTVENAEIINESFPSFFSIFSALGANIKII